MSTRILLYRSLIAAALLTLLLQLFPVPCSLAQGLPVALAAGVLCRMEELKVAIPRGALEEAKRHGLTDAIKTVESLDRAIVEKWPVERLTLIGASKKLKESYSYELKQLNS